jgi:hypothetical protein
MSGAAVLANITLVVILGSFVLTLLRRPARRLPASGPTLGLLALALIISGFFLEKHALLGMPYSPGRTAVFYAPLMALLFILSLVSIGAYSRLKTAATTACIIAALAAAGHLLFAANTSYAWEWKLDADYKTPLTDLQDLRGKFKPADQPLKLAGRTFAPLLHRERSTGVAENGNHPPKRRQRRLFSQRGLRRKADAAHQKPSPLRAHPRPGQIDAAGAPSGLS